MSSRLLVGPLLDEEQAAPFVAPDDWERARAFPPRRRSEYLSWRALLGRELGHAPRIVYEASGAPRLLDFEGYIGVSHSRSHAAVCISDRPCAVDIESLSRNFTLAGPRYMTPSERLLSSEPYLAAAVWCAKECLYKYAGREGLDLLRDLSVEHVDFRTGCIAGRIAGGSLLGMCMKRFEGDLAVWL